MGLGLIVTVASFVAATSNRDADFQIWFGPISGSAILFLIAPQRFMSASR